MLERVPSVHWTVLHTCLFTCTKLSDVGCAKHVDQGGNSTPRGAGAQTEFDAKSVNNYHL